MGRRFTVDEDGYYVGSVPELPGCHTQANPQNTHGEDKGGNRTLPRNSEHADNFKIARVTSLRYGQG
jgi:hypothetical protein